MRGWTMKMRGRTKMRGWTMTIAALLLAACGSGDAPPPDPAADTVAPAESAQTTGTPADSEPSASAPAQSAPGRTPADLAIAAEVAKEGTNASAAQDPEYTPWRAVEMPSEPWSQSAANAQALLTRVRGVVAAQLEEPDASVLPTRMESRSAAGAVGILVHPDQADDSVRDVEFRIHMRPQGSAWTVSAVERRERCRRGVAQGGLCA